VTLRCGQKCGRKCGFGIHTWRVVSPRQHLGLTGAPSPTTRPPRMNTGGFRVVGLGAWCFWKLAGAGFSQWWIEVDGLVGDLGVVSGVGGGVERWEV